MNYFKWFRAVFVDSLPLDVLGVVCGVIMGLVVVLARQAVEQLRVLPAQQAEQVLQQVTRVKFCI